MLSHLEAVEVIVCLNGLRSHIVDGATTNVPLNACLLGLNPVGYAKVNQFEPSTNAHKVLWLQVIVDHTFIVDYLK